VNLKNSTNISGTAIEPRPTPAPHRQINFNRIEVELALGSFLTRSLRKKSNKVL